MASDADSLIGRRLSHYRIVEHIGAGGMGVLYKAEDTRLGRSVALKFVSDVLSRDSEALDRFAREAQLASALNHPNICTIYDIGDQGERSFIVMEYLEGATLRDRLAAGALGLNAAVEIGLQIADALDAAHAAGIIHRDIKPANIFIASRDRVKVLDFGLAKSRAAAPTADVTTVAGTRQGLVMGTAAYMAPEQAAGEIVDHRADIWSFGLVLYEMVKGRRPPQAVRLRIEASPELERIVAKCLETDREFRYQHAAELRTDLERLRRGSDSSTTTRELPAIRAGRRRTVAAAVCGAVALGAAAYVFYPRPAKLTDRDTIVLAEFTNRTGDPVFEETLRQGLAVELQQSPFLSLIGEERIRKELRLMEQPADARFTPQLAHDVCVRTGSAAVVDGSIGTLGSQFVLGVRASNCATGDILAAEQATAPRKEDVLGALSQMAGRLRTRLGESLATVEKYSKPLEQATTSSLEALRAFTTASSTYYSRGAAAAIPLFERATAIDPTFASAYARLGIHYSNVRESTRARENTLKAYRLRDRVSDLERFWIDTFYDRQVTGNVERQQQTMESWARTYPRDPVPHGLNAGFATGSTGQYEQSIAAAERSLALDPDRGPSINSKVFSLLRLNRVADVDATLRRAAASHVEFPDLVLAQYFLAFLRGDVEDLGRQAARARAQRATADMIPHLEALALARAGRLQDARRSSATAVEIAQNAGQRERAALFDAAVANWEAFYGKTSAAKQGATTVLDLAGGRDVEYAAAFALALAGDVSRARSLAEALAKNFPEDTSVQSMYLPTLRALFSLKARDAPAALQSLQAASRFDLALGALAFNGYFGGLYPIYVRGLAYLADKRPAAAAAEFQRIVDHRGIVLVDPLDAMARLQLARALTLAGDTVKAKRAYDDVLTLWKDADPGIPAVEGARLENAKLR